MLEIVVLIWLCNTNKKNAVQRGRKPDAFIALTLLLWIGLEIVGAVVGAAGGLESGMYFLAILFAVIGGVISYFVAKNCRIGDYVTPVDKATAEILNSPEVLETPATLEIIRDSSMVGALADFPVTLNGQRLASIRNGSSITVQTDRKHNILSIKDAYGTDLSPYIFDMADGGYAKIHFKAGKFQPAGTTGTLSVSTNTTGGVVIGG